ncbi:aromatic amino acid hydroxylase [Hyalangium minutum]|uniref:Phenylalanine-4-hydroxylase n=1 Tax=Hyalangium minutum TaxID=394096 RepID=A0A085WN99_9BACT|nr:aromatic amino acid hydroxylase [Hyalangium minutum]KFE69162.1 Phenylalanine-4-hydroxylase [Hyalangium minutum]
MTPTEKTLARLPAHLRRYVVGQDYASYTPRDQAVWRHILGRLRSHLSDKAHPVYLEGLEATGIGVERIPSLDEMNERLAQLGWAAVGVRGFIPPEVFTELQSLGVLAIAADIRTHEHIQYTPAPDIVHESAGHAPIIANTRYAEYLKRCGMVGFKAIASVEDQAIFEAIRNLSVVKEDPTSTPEQVEHAQARLDAATRCRRYVSESTKAARLYWWTAEYGLIGSLERPRLFGAGLLSSIGEAEHCLTSAVKKVPLSLVCAETEYDITRMQPQLFVARDFEHLFEVVEQFEASLSWKRGGDHGLREAHRARSVNHLVLADRREVTGRVVELFEGVRPVKEGLTTALVRLSGPVMLSRDAKAQGKPWQSPTLVAFGAGTLPERGEFQLELASGLRLEGFAVGGGEVLRLKVKLGERTLESLPSVARLFLSEGLPSVAGGPADPEAWDHWFGELSAFTEGDGEAQARARKAEALPPALATLYRDVRALRESGERRLDRLETLMKAANAFPDEWLLWAELNELHNAFQGAPLPGTYAGRPAAARLAAH